jgi:hypothetical protein
MTATQQRAEFIEDLEAAIEAARAGDIEEATMIAQAAVREILVEGYLLADE